MSWFFGSPSSSPPPPEGKDPSPTPTPTPKDPIASLEPSLREYLQSQYTKSRTTTSSTSTSASSNIPPSPSNNPPPTNNPSSYGTRYSHLWATYQPPYTTITPATEQEALTTIMRAHHTRKTLLTRTALENCSEIELALHECYRSGGLKGRLTNCSKQAKQLDDCYSTQVKLLRALGYMAEVGRERAVEESIQLHADRLYREKVREEREAEERVGRRREGEGKVGEVEEVEEVEEGWLKLKAGWGPKRGEEGIGRTKMGGVEIVIEPAGQEGEGEKR
ncbi:hypothetical protein BGX38DRAFT_1094544 [Terfezia claveryi]|nr:hypothetical protein BGX38DRAFT_1094544 [Terfezia claveryi]